MTTLLLTHEAFLAHDTGEGHPERPDRLRAVAKVLEHEIFKPLVRLHSASAQPGTGLGLTLARKAALVQNGEIRCESQLGVGSTFFVRVPAAPKQLADLLPQN